MTREWRRWLVELTIVLAGFVCAVLLVTEFIARPWVVAGPSMEPGIRSGDRLIVDLWTYRQRPPRLGELVLILGSSPLPHEMVKRRVAPPAEAGGTGARRNDGSRTIWVAGDNRERSVDSRHFGPIATERVVGRPVWRYWPPGRAGRIR